MDSVKNSQTKERKKTQREAETKSQQRANSKEVKNNTASYLPHAFTLTRYMYVYNTVKLLATERVGNSMGIRRGAGLASNQLL
jgi:hypothetical protein